MCVQIEEEAALVHLWGCAVYKEGCGGHFNSSRRELDCFGAHFNRFTLITTLREDRWMWKAIRKEFSHQATVIIYAEGSHHSDQGMISSRIADRSDRKHKEARDKERFSFLKNQRDGGGIWSDGKIVQGEVRCWGMQQSLVGDLHLVGCRQTQECEMSGLCLWWRDLG